MKKTIALCLLAATLFVAAPGFGGEARPKVGLFIASLDTFLTVLADSAQKRANELGIDLTLMDSQYDTIRQNDQVMTCLSDGTQVLIINLVETTSAPTMIAAAKEKNIPIVFVNRSPFSNKDEIPPNCYVVAPDSIREGAAGMEYAGKLMGGKGNIVILQGTSGHEPARLRTEGVKKVIREQYPDIKIIAEETGDWFRDKGMSVMENLITAYGDQIDAVLANNDEMALGAKLALAASGMDDVIVVGVDGTSDAITSISRPNGINGTAFQDAVAQGEGCVEVARKLIDGVVNPPESLLPVDMITRENVEEFKKNMKK